MKAIPEFDMPAQTADRASRAAAETPRLTRVSILMLVFNRPQFIGRAIRSVLAQDYQDWELIIAQEGAHPEIQAIVAEWVKRDSRIRYFSRVQSGNLANGYNFGSEQARGEYIAILDDDDYWVVPDKLTRQVAFLDAHPEYVGCGGGVLVTDETGKELMRLFKPEHDEQIKRLALIANPIVHSTGMFRRSVGAHLNRYDDALGGVPDWDIWLNLGRLGKLHNFGELFTCYTLWKHGVSFERQRANARSALKIVWKHRKSYQWFGPALGLALLGLLYAWLPPFVRDRSFFYLSCAKKMIFASRCAAKTGHG